MAGTLTRRSWRELSRRKARAFFTVATIAAAVIGLWMFAVPPLIDGAMDERVQRDLLWDLRLSPNGIALTDADISAIGGLPNIAGVEARVLWVVQAVDGDRRTDALLVGVDDFADQEVNVVSITEGEVPGAGQVLSDPQNARSGRFEGGLGHRFALGGQPVEISGFGTTLQWSASVDDDDPVFYLQLDRLQDAIGVPGITWIDLRVDDDSPEGMVAAADGVRDYLASVDPEITYWEALQIREPGTWPEKEDIDNVIQLTYIIAAVGLISALFMVYTTMNSVVREQTREIGIIKAVGGTRRPIVVSYLKTAALLAALGTAFGTAAGIPLANLLVGFAGRQFSGVEPDFGVPIGVLALSVSVGMFATMAAALPAIFRATRVPVREALIDHGVEASFGADAIDGVLRRFRLAPRMARLGMRNAARRKGRSIVTAVQIGLAVGTFLAFLGLGVAIMDITAQTFDGEGGEIIVSLSADAGDVIADVPGVAVAEPVVYTGAGIGGETYQVQGQGPGAAYFHDDLEEGRWFTPTEEAEARPVAVLGPALANTEGVVVGDTVDIETTLGRARLDVVGIDSLMIDDGKVVFMPLSTTLSLTEEAFPEAYFVATAETDEAFVDATAADIDKALVSAGIPARVDTRYVEREAELTTNRTIVGILLILGIPVIAIGMIGLVNMLTTGIIERTREIGILRSIGARARHIRRITSAEALAVAFLGWLAAIPLGYVIARVLIALVNNAFEAAFPVMFPLWPLPLALIATLLLARLVVLIPVHRATRLSPGTALRYE